MRVRVQTVLLWAGLIAITIGCGSSSSPSPAPSNPIPPPAQEPIPAIAGDWTGTFESPNLPPRTISFTIVQSAGYCIDGAWKDTADQWSGALSGVATSTAFSGSVSVESKTSDGTLCTSVATIEGPMSEKSLDWKIGTFSPTPLCPGLFPTSGELKLAKK